MGDAAGGAAATPACAEPRVPVSQEVSAVRLGQSRATVAPPSPAWPHPTRDGAAAPRAPCRPLRCRGPVRAIPPASPGGGGVAGGRRGRGLAPRDGLKGRAGERAEAKRGLKTRKSAQRLRQASAQTSAPRAPRRRSLPRTRQPAVDAHSPHPSHGDAAAPASESAARNRRLDTGPLRALVAETVTLVAAVTARKPEGDGRLVAAGCQ